jgi:uncharacterized protein YozE (UPF0346 family)
MKSDKFLTAINKRDASDSSRVVETQKKARVDFGSGYHPISHDEAQKYADRVKSLLKHKEYTNSINKVFDIIQKRKKSLIDNGDIEEKNHEAYKILHDLQRAIFSENDNDIEKVVASVKTLSRTSQLVRESFDTILNDIEDKIPGISLQEETNRIHPMNMNTFSFREISLPQQTSYNQTAKMEEKLKNLQEVKTRAVYNRIKTELRPANSNEKTVGEGQWSKDTLKDFATLLYRDISFPKEARDYMDNNRQMRWTKDEADYILRAAFDYKKAENGDIEPNKDWKDNATKHVRSYSKSNSDIESKVQYSNQNDKSVLNHVRHIFNNLSHRSYKGKSLMSNSLKVADSLLYVSNEKSRKDLYSGMKVIKELVYEEKEYNKLNVKDAMMKIKNNKSLTQSEVLLAIANAIETDPSLQAFLNS